MRRGEVAFTGEVPAGQDLTPISNPAAEYPVLLYDGPFSDGAQGATFKALEGMSSVSGEEATRLLKEFVGADSVTQISLDGESVQDIPCYDFSLVANGYNLSASVTKQGRARHVPFVLERGGSDEFVGDGLHPEDAGVPALRAVMAPWQSTTTRSSTTS